MKAHPLALLTSLCLSACVPVSVPATTAGSGDHFAAPYRLPPPGPDGGWIIGAGGRPVFIGQPEPNPPSLER